ncbi:MAG TPA: hypothetical protein VGN97_00620 [Mesorhizobium sp.]|nr:hypothetical protein [Mesorhizobium sp.]
MIRPPALLLGLLLSCAVQAALADAPGLAAYVRDDDADVYVALFGDDAVELDGCANEAAARALLALPAAPIRETTLAALQASHRFGSLKIPCPPSGTFDASLPATAPIWFDAAGSQRYVIASSGQPDLFYAVPSRCTGIKEAFALRQRIGLPGVLQTQPAPPRGPEFREIVLDCGDGAAAPQDGTAAASDSWRLYQADVFLSENSLGDTIYVAAFNSLTGGVPQRRLLPIYRINGAPAGDGIWQGSNGRDKVEAALAELLGTDPAAAVEALPAADLAALGGAVHLDLCLTDCVGYNHRHAAFIGPERLALAVLAAPAPYPALDRLGRATLRWDFAEARTLSLANCDGLAAAMGMAPADRSALNWDEAAAAALSEPLAASGTASFACRPPDSALCVRTVPQEGVVSQALLAKGPDCSGADTLLLELPPTARIAEGLLLDGSVFAAVEIRPLDAGGRSRLVFGTGRRVAPSSICPFEPVPAAIEVRGLNWLAIERVDLARAADGPAEEAAALVLEEARASLDHVSIGSAGEGLRPFERAVRLCRSELYGFGGALQGSSLALHGLDSRLALGGAGEQDRVAVSSGGFGLVLISSALQLAWAQVTAPRAVQLRASRFKGLRLDLSPGAVSGLSQGLRLERDARAELELSQARGFGCLGVFFHPSAFLRVLLPLNALAADNGRLHCGEGVMDIVE